MNTITDYIKNKKILTLTHAPLGSCTATGQLTGKLFKNVLPANLLSYYTVFYDTNLEFEKKLLSESAQFMSEVQKIKAFSPDLCYVYLFNNTTLLNFIVLLQKELQCIFIVHIMDDWLELEKNTINNIYPRLKYAVESIILNSHIHYAISIQMASDLTNRYKVSFAVLHNFLYQDEIDIYKKSKKVDTSKTFTLFYTGATNNYMNSSALETIAKVVSLLSEEIPITFHIRTFKRDFNMISQWKLKYKNLKITCINDNDHYPDSFHCADLLIIANNFDALSRSYIKNSLANKLCEYLATEIPILAFGPEDNATISTLNEAKAAICVTENNETLIYETIRSIYEKVISVDAYLICGKKLLKSEFNEAHIYKYYQEITQSLENKEKILSNSIKKNTIAAILGNGASLKGFDFKKNLEGMTTFGMNAAYRYWDTINWYPDYYCCLDLVVGLSHKEEIKRLIENSSKYGIKQFLLRDNLIQALGDFQCKEKVLNFDKINQNSLFLAEPRITTGSHTCAWAAEMGFKNILLLGIDSNYVEMIPEASLNDAQELVIEKTPKYNPNYFFDNYQQAGDKYNIPNHSSEPTKMVHRASWNNLSTSFTQYDVVVLNGSMNSMLNCFYKIDFANMQEMFSSLRKQHIIVDNLYLPTKKISENDIVIHYFDGNKGIMLEVGAHHGSETIKQLAAGWQVYAFEPDDNNREKFIMKTAAYFNQITLDNRAVSNKSNELCSFYTSEVSTGISSLASFHESHRKTKEVKTITLRDYITEESIKYIDFLKIDAEGFDLMVLKGFPFETIQPKCILCEFEDNKTLSLGYNMADMKLFLENHGYTVYVSEWCPIKEYGVSHTWKRIFKGEPITFSPNAWGNLLAFKEDPGEEKIKELLLKPAPTFSYKQPCFAKVYKNMFKYRVLSFFSFGEQKKKNRLRYKSWKIRLATFSPKQIKVYILGILVLSILVHSNIKIFQLFSILPFMITKKTFSNHKIRILGLQVYKQKIQG